MLKKLPFNFTTVVLLLLVGAFIIRVGVFFWAKQVNQRVSDDSEVYKQIAQRLIEGKGFYNTNYQLNGKYLRSYVPPLTPLVAAGILKISGTRWWAVHLFLSLVGAITCLNIIFIARILFGEKIGLFSGALSSAYPMFAFLPSLLLTENFSLFFYTAAILLVFKITERYSLKVAAVLGVVLGFGTLCRTEMAGFGILLIVYIYFVIREPKKLAPLKKIAYSVVILLCWALVMLPWTIRNYKIHHKFILFPTGGGITFWAGHNKYVRDGFRLPLEYVVRANPDSPYNWNCKDEVEWSRKGYIEGLKFIKSYPLLDLKYDFYKLWLFWNPYNHIVHKLTYFPILVLGLFGVYLTRKKARDLIIFYVLVLYLMAVSVIFQGLPRYGFPVMVFLLITAAVALGEIARYVKNRISHRKARTAQRHFSNSP
jgi:4-amino-4-deoxy-L-arabinose transferase-like glycosyltransferase